MREARVYSFRTRFPQCARNFCQRTTRVAHVVDDQTIAPANVTNDIHHLGDVGLLATLVAEREFCVEWFRVGASTFSPACIRSNDGQVRQWMIRIGADKYRRGIKLVDRNIK